MEPIVKKNHVQGDETSSKKTDSTGEMPNVKMDKKKPSVAQLTDMPAVQMQKKKLPLSSLGQMPSVPMDKKSISSDQPRAIVPLYKGVTGDQAKVPLSKGLIGAPGTPLLTYGNGPLLTNAQVITIFWGAGWTQSAQSGLLTQVNQFFDVILTSSLMDLIGQYSVPGQTIGHGSRIGTFTDSGSEPGGGAGQVSDAQVRQEVQTLINNGNVPPANANTLYFVYLPPNVTLTGPTDAGGGTSCVDFCGYHWFIPGSNPEIYYAAMPFPGCNGCLGGLSQIQSLTSVSSHELIEGITDPHPWSGWNSAQGEIGDICAWQVDVISGYTVQKEWSNKDGACTIGHANPAWSGWEGLGGIIQTPHAVCWGSNRIDVFARGTDNAMYHRWWDGANWGGWENLGGVILSDPVAVSWGANRLDVFAEGTDGAVYHRWWDGANWGGWESLGGVITSNISAVCWGPNRIDLFARGTDMAMYHMWWDGANWGGWESLGGVIISDPVAVSWGANRLDVFAQGTDGAVYHRWWDGANWGGWESLGGVITSNISAVSWSSNRIDLFARGTDLAMYHRWWDGANWGGWESLGGVIISDPIAVSWSANRLDVFAEGTDGAVYHRWWDGANWGGWESLGGVVTSNISAVSWAANRLDLFVRGTDNAMYHQWFT
jgi:hypothetical protein